MSDLLTRATPDEQFAEVTRAHVDLQVPQELKDKLKRSYDKKKPLIIKAGFDPTAPDLHLGHTVVLQRMRRFQEFGHQIVFIIGGFTAMIGDPTGKNATRPPLSKEQVLANAETYKQQLFKVLDREKTIVRNNNEWLEPLGAQGMIRLAARYPVARMLERADFKKRFEEGKSIAIHEFLYPLLQGWDSVAIQSDVELGGSDQIFNLLVGRQLMKEEGLEPQVVLTSPLLEGLDAKLVDGKLVGDKMSKSHGNYVGVSEPPNEQYGKLLSVSDDLMWRYYDLLSAKTTSEISELRRKVSAGELHPKAAKVMLAKEIVTRFNDAAAADAAEQYFENRSKGNTPDDVPEKSISLAGAKSMNIRKVCVEAGLASSNSDAQRLIQGGGLSINGEKMVDPKRELEAGSYLLKAGKLRFAKVTLA
ncbi:MAG: tyrosine--tRNA ligase [Deltaproteobacteria bacterium]|nr:tyrosine--tRNA ligase [Deltaproteobacteria bacterium]